MEVVMFFDTHMHTEFSCDSHMTIQQAMKVGEELAIGIIITEHWDRYYPTNPEQFIFDVDKFFAVNKQYRSDTVLLGIEIGMQENCAQQDTQLITSYEFDQVVASIHCVQGRDIYEPTAYLGYTKDEMMEAYLVDTIKCLELYEDFDSLGHIDYICRYMPYEDKHLNYHRHQQLWDKAFRLLIERDSSLELNTRRLSEVANVQQLLPLYQAYKNLGGKQITIASDAHYVEHIGRGIETVVELAQELQL